MGFDLSTYYPIFIYLLVILAFAVGGLVAAHTDRPATRTTPVKQMPYESGMDPIGDARQRFDVKFYLIAILFLVFDVELLFLYPWAVAAYGEAPLLPARVPQRRSSGKCWSSWPRWSVAYVYAWRKGVFQWR